ncbi:MAG: TonB-dependent receptor [Dysgonamonadaceae bacterium]|jgi:TonB-linked SusC/RagA family outer membrane protein|nr:TonB-dependent receptor [Dysgonamonadaceae bacterium]
MKKNRLKEKSRIMRAFFTVVICFGMAVSGFAQTKTIKGVVSDASTNEPIIGASVTVTGTQRGTATSVNGEFSLEASPNETLTITYLGYIPQKVNIGNKTTFDVHLEINEEVLEEVVVSTGYLTQKKSTLTGSVSTVSSKDIVVTKNENVVNALAGKLPGLRITQKTSQPGAYNTVIDIRGLGTPLFVIDGVPRDQAYFSRMDPEEIESVSILKDGTAAIYGLRAANGVLLVTTKSGTSQNGKVDITYSSNFTAQQFLYVPEGISATEWMDLINEQNWQDFSGNYLIHRNARYTQDQYQPYLDGTKKSYNWINEVFKKTTPQQQHNLSVNGGNDRLRYFFSLAYSKQDGSLKSDDMWGDRWNMRSNIDARITNRLKARISLGAILNTTQNPRSDWSLYKYAWLMKPTASVYANDNPLYPNGDVNVLQDGNNPVIQTQKQYVGYNLSHQRRMNGSLTLTYDVPKIKGLSAKAMYDYNFSLPDSQNFSKTYSLFSYDPASDNYSEIVKGSPASASRSTSFNYDTDMQLGLYYQNRFGEHNVNGTLLFEEAYNFWDGGFNASREIMVNSEYISVGEETNQKGGGGTPGERLNQAFIGNIAYDYAGKYMGTFLFRYDGSSKFPVGSRWGFFPSFQLAWRLSEEGFIKNKLDFISNLKIRASYGKMGDDSSASNYPSTYVFYSGNSNRAWIFEPSGLTHGANGINTSYNIPGIANSKLTWYTTEMYNLALDFGVLKNSLSGTFELWKRDRKGLLATSSAVVPGTVGASLPQENLNSDRHFGWEVELKYQNRWRELNYYVSSQISATKHMRLDWLETPANNSMDKWRNRSANRYTDIWWTRQMGGMFTSYDEIRNFYLPQGQGTVPGDWWGEDWNGDGIVNDDDNHPYATYGLPVFNYGINMGASWRNLDLAANFQGAYGIYAAYGEVLVEALSFGGANTLSWFMDRWHPVDPEADIFDSRTQWVEGYYPITGHDGRRQASNNVNNTSYLRLKTLELGYTLPKKWMSKAGIKNLRLYVNGYNLLTFSGLHGIDPERPGSSGGASSDYIDFYSYPVNKTYTVGINIKF